jgi:hypothetical protein
LIWLAIHCWAHANKRSAISTDVVFVRAELATLSSDALEFLLRRGVRIANVHEKTFLSNADTIELANNVVANVTRFEALAEVRNGSGYGFLIASYVPSESDTTAVAHVVMENLARQNGVAKKDGAKLLLGVSMG